MRVASLESPESERPLREHPHQAGGRPPGARVPIRREQLWLLWGVAAALLVSVLVRWGWRAGWWAARAEVVKGPESEYRIDLNEAGEAELALLPGIGEVKAARIVAYRKEHGPFHSLDELAAVEGIFPSLLGRLRPYVRLSAGSGRAEPAEARLGPGTGREGEEPSSSEVSSSR
jgi:competence ComEA-like helix-hairpin-helix protein